jgi:TP901 family phage tail tape measure protein
VAGRTVVVALSATTTGFTEGTNKASAALKNVAKAGQAAGQSVDAGLSKATSAAAKLEAAQRKAADAAGKARVAQARLVEAQKSSAAGSAKQIAAQEKLAAASRNLTASEKALAAAAKEANAALNQPSAKTSILSQIDAKSGSINKLSNGLGLAGAAVAAGVGVAIKAAAQFDQAMSGVAATGGDARASLQALRDAAIQAGAATKFSATEAAQGEEALAKAGVSAKDVLGGGLNGALALAAAGNQSVADAAETAASAMNQFGLSGKDVPHIADLLAQAAGTAQGEVSDMAGALNQSGLIAHQFGLSIEDTTQALALFAKNGLVGSDAGTSFKTMLTSLYAPSGTAATALKNLGVSAYDSAGGMKSIGSLSDELKAKLDQLSEGDRNSALKNIFGSDALRAGTILLKDGSKGLADMATEFGKFGTAADVARTKMDNLSGDLENFKGSLDTALIGLGEGGQGPLRSLVESATNAVNAFNDLGAGTKQTILIIGGSVAVLALAAAAIGKVAVAAAEARTALAGMGTSFKGVAASAGAAIAAFAAVEAGAQVLGHFQSDAKGVDALSNSLLNIAHGSSDLTALYSKGSWADALMGSLTGSLAQTDDLAGALKAVNAESNGTGFQKFIFGLGSLREQITPGTQGLEKMRQQVTDVDQALAGLATNGNAKQASDAFNAIAKQTGVPVETLIKLMPQYTDALNKNAAAAQGAASATQPTVYSAAAAALTALQGSSGGAAQSMTDLANSLIAAGSAALQMSGNQIGVEAAIDAAAEAVKRNGKTLDITTQKGRDNKQALDAIASSSLNLIQAQTEQGASAKTLTATTQHARDAFVSTGRQMGLTKKQAEDLATKYGLIPKDVKTKAEMKAEQAKTEAAKVKNAIKDIPPKKQAEILAIWQKQGYDAAISALNSINGKTARTYVVTYHQTVNKGTVKAQANAEGGHIRGQGTSTSDSILSWLSNGEFVIKAASVQAIGVDRLAYANQTGQLPAFAGGGLAGYAAGGAVSVSSAISVATLLRLIEALNHPITDIATAAKALAKAQKENAVEQRKIAAPTRRRDAAVRAYNRAVNRRNDLRDEALQLKKRADATKGVTAADREYHKVQQQLSEANARVSKTSHEKTVATAAYNKVASKAKEASSALKEAQKALADQQNALADAARSVSDSFYAGFVSKTDSVKDWIALMTQGSKDLGAFNGKIAKLRKAGLSETLIQQIISRGAVVGGSIADQILKGGASLVKALDKADASLQSAADNLGLTATKAPQRKATGGFITGPGTSTSDSISARLSTGEYVVNAAATAAHRSLLDSINYSRPAPIERRAAFATGGYVQPPMIDIEALRAAGGVHLHIEHWHGGDPDATARALDTRRRDAMAMSAMSMG